MRTLRSHSALILSSASLLAVLACGSEDPTPGDGEGSGGAVAASGGAVSSGGATGSGGAVSSGGTMGSGGSVASGGAAAGGSGTGGLAESSGGADGSGGAATASFALQSPSWDAVDNDDCTPETAELCPLYPEDNTSFGANVSPEMSWVGVPEGTLSFVILLHDLSNGFEHWAIWDIPATTTMLPAELPMGASLTDPAGAKQAGLQGAKYFGSGACGNTYEHRLYALKVASLDPASSTASSVRDKLDASTDILGESFVRLQSREYCE